jgi:hypothetical protein
VTFHIFRALDPDPRPAGWIRALGGERRAGCTCGWQAATNSGNDVSASARWSADHYASLPTSGDAA